MSDEAAEAVLSAIEAPAEALSPGDAPPPGPAEGVAADDVQAATRTAIRAMAAVPGHRRGDARVFMETMMIGLQVGGPLVAVGGTPLSGG